MSRFDYIKYDESSESWQKDFKELVQKLEMRINDLGQGAHQTLALRKLEETYMWIGKAIRDKQIERNGSAELQEERKDG